VIWGFVFSSLAIFRFLESGPRVGFFVLAAIAIALPLLAVINHRAVGAVYRVAAIVTAPIGFLVSRVVLAIVFYVVVTPIGLSRRVLGNDDMGRGSSSSDESLWTQRGSRESLDDAFKQY